MIMGLYFFYSKNQEIKIFLVKILNLFTNKIIKRRFLIKKILDKGSISFQIKIVILSFVLTEKEEKPTGKTIFAINF